MTYVLVTAAVVAACYFGYRYREQLGSFFVALWKTLPK